MKMNYSNAMMINSLGKNYQMKQQLNSSKSNYLIAGILTGFVVGGTIYYFYCNKQIETITANMRRQLEINNQLYAQWQKVSQQLNLELEKQSLAKDSESSLVIKDSPSK